MLICENIITYQTKMKIETLFTFLDVPKFIQKQYDYP